MGNRGRIIFSCVFLSVVWIHASGFLHAETTEDEVLAAMKKAAGFMADVASTRGGYVFQYKADLSERWGEIPARESQIWVQPPGTPTVGMMLLEAYRTTGEPVFLDYAERAADALVWGQHPSGGWHYFIDFDMPGVRKWYDEVASKCWGWEEYLHYYGNCTFDDESTTAPAKFLLELYMLTLDPRYRVPLLKALDFILEAQYPNGAWPQRYPLKNEFVHGGHPDYTSYYTFNDGVMRNNIDILLEAWEKLGDERYLKTARRGMDFYILSQLPEPQAGWADQYDHDLKPAWARMFEPPAVSSIQTIRSIRDLEFFYRATGDRRYLGPIPAALEWLENSVINTDPSKKFYHPFFGRAMAYTHAYYYELGTNRPIFAHRSGTSVEDERFWISYEMEDMYPYGPPYVIDVKALREEYERVRALSPEEARAEYEESRRKPAETPRVKQEEVENIMKSMDERGAWVTEIVVPDYLNNAIDSPRKHMPGISVRVYLKNMYTLVNYLKGKEK